MTASLAPQRAAARALPVWVREHANARGFTLDVYVQPNARASAPAGCYADALKLRIAAPAVDNRANEALIDYLTGALQIARGAARIVQGATARRKRVAIAMDIERARALLAAWDNGETR